MMVVQCSTCGVCFKFGGPPFSIEAIKWEVRSGMLMCHGCVKDETRRRLKLMQDEGWNPPDVTPDTSRNVIVAWREDGDGARITTIGFYTESRGWYAVTDDLEDRINVHIDWWRELPPHPEASK